MKKHIVCFGDSNTHGYCADPRDCADGGIRFNENERWTKLLQEKLGDDYLVVEEGLSGRTTCFDDPIHEAGGLTVLKGNLAPNGSIVKSAAVPEDMMQLKGPAKVYNSEEDAVEAIFNHELKEGDILVIRCEGPKGGPGMREMLNPTSAIMGMGIKNVGLITDGRFSGGTAGAAIGHVSPEAARGGMIAFVEDYDIIGAVSGEGRKVKVWVNTGRDQINIINNMVNDEFTPKSGINVQLELVQGNMIEATLAGKGPDIYMGLDSATVINYAIRDAVIGISFPRYSKRAAKALRYASDRGAETIAITDTILSPLAQCSKYKLLAKSDMVSLVDSLVAPLSVINALIAACAKEKKDNVYADLKALEEIWDEYRVYSTDREGKK